MSDGTKIEWSQATWNPVTGCTPIPGIKGRPSGCDRCYAHRLIDTRLVNNPTSVRFGRPFAEVMLHADRLDQPLRWKRPRRIFVNSLSDLFHVDVPREFIDRVIAMTMLASQHTFQILTKRPERMRAYLDSYGNRYEDLERAADEIGTALTGPERERRFWASMNAYLPNVQFGVSVSTNDDARRANELRQVAEGLRWISAEPLLGPLDQLDLAGIGWVVCGGESGPGARPMHPWWVRELRDRCVEAGIPFFFKQWGEWKPISDMADGESDALYHPAPTYDPEGRWRCKVATEILQLDGSLRLDFPTGAMQVFRVGKKAAGRTLDGRIWDEYPRPLATVA